MKMTFDLGLEDRSFKARITKAQRTKFFFSRDVSSHGVFQAFLNDGEKEYETSFPIMLQEGVEWEFAKGKVYKVSETQQREYWAEVIAKFPHYTGGKDFNNNDINAFIRWFCSGEAEAFVINKGVYTDKNGIDHNQCLIVKPSAEKSEHKPIATAMATAAKPAPVPPKNPTPPAPAATARVFTSEDAWNAYEGGERIKGDPNGAQYWGEVERIVGRPANDYGSFTSDDWRRCVEAFGHAF